MAAIDEELPGHHRGYQSHLEKKAKGSEYPLSTGKEYIFQGCSVQPETTETLPGSTQFSLSPLLTPFNYDNAKGKRYLSLRVMSLHSLHLQDFCVLHG
jgi:hypothetical protein